MALGAGAAFAVQASIVELGSTRPGYGSGDPLVVLAIGSDTGPPHRPTDPLRGNADAIHLLVVDTVGLRATVVDIPRDGIVVGTKVNAHLRLGGPNRLEAALERWSGLAIDFWVLGSFFSLERVVDGLGGLGVVIDAPLNDPFSGSNLAPGHQVLNGQQALAFARDRHSVPSGDIGRSAHQGQLLRWAHAQLRATNPDGPRLLQLVSLLARNTATNIPPAELLPLALLAVQIPAEQVAQVTLSGPTRTLDGQSALLLQPGGLFGRLAAGQIGP